MADIKIMTPEPKAEPGKQRQIPSKQPPQGGEVVIMKGDNPAKKR